jgi:hypothetical protein
MDIIFRKKSGKPHAMQCLRNGQLSDQTWQHSDDFYVFHDLIHYAVEKTLSIQQGFYGMLKSGVSIHDFSGPRDQRPVLGRDAVMAETLVSVFQHEAFQGVLDDFNEAWIANQQLMGVQQLFAPLDEQILATIRQTVGDLIERWENTPVDGSLTLQF